jgi:hypothetical protein
VLNLAHEIGKRSTPNAHEIVTCERRALKTFESDTMARGTFHFVQRHPACRLLCGVHAGASSPLLRAGHFWE